MVADLPTCFPTGLRSKDFAVSHSPDSANATATAIAWNLSLHDLILNLARRFNLFAHISHQIPCQVDIAAPEARVESSGAFSGGSFGEVELH